MCIKESSYRNGLIAVSLNAIIIGMSYYFVKLGLRYANPQTMLFDRVTVASLVLILSSLFGMKFERIKGKDRIFVFLISILYPVLFFGLQIFGIKNVPASQGALIYSFMPLATIIGSYIIIKEKASFYQVLGAIISAVGVIYITLSSFSGHFGTILGYIFLIGSMLTFVLYLICIRRLSQRISPLTITYYVLLYSFVSMLCIAIVNSLFTHNFDTDFSRLRSSTYIFVVLYLGIASTLLSSWFANYATKVLPANVVAIFSNLNPVFGLFFAMVMSSSIINHSDILGSIIVFIGVIIGGIRKSK